MICYVDLEHPERGPSILSAGPEATQRKADLLTIKSGRTILANFFRLARAAAPRSEARAPAHA
jgi:hypothetical protein